MSTFKKEKLKYFSWTVQRTATGRVKSRGNLNGNQYVMYARFFFDQFRAVTFQTARGIFSNYFRSFLQFHTRIIV